MDEINGELSFFGESVEVISIIQSICEEESRADYTVLTENLSAILLKYQEQPVLLNASLPDMLEPLMEAILAAADSIINTTTSTANLHFNGMCKVVQLICRVRGFKHVVKHFPHNVANLELCLVLLQKQVSSQF